jgi:DNA polymerase eta
MSLSFTGLERLEGGQQGIEGFFGNKPIGESPTKTETVKRQRSSSPSKSTNMSKDEIKAITPMSESPRKKPRLPTLQSGSSRSKTGLETFLSKKGESSSSSRNSPVIIEEDEIIELDRPRRAEVGDGDGWSCPKCDFKTNGGLSAIEVKGEKQEHEDFHFAQDLQNGVSPVRSKAVSGIGTSQKKKTKVEGIKAFFTAKPVVKKE